MFNLTSYDQLKEEFQQPECEESFVTNFEQRCFEDDQGYSAEWFHHSRGEESLIFQDSLGNQCPLIVNYDSNNLLV